MVWTFVYCLIVRVLHHEPRTFNPPLSLFVDHTLLRPHSHLDLLSQLYLRFLLNTRAKTILSDILRAPRNKMYHFYIHNNSYTAAACGLYIYVRHSEPSSQAESSFLLCGSRLHENPSSWGDTYATCACDTLARTLNEHSIEAPACS